MVVLLSFKAKQSAFEKFFFPPLNLIDNYECGLLYFSACNSIPNVTNDNNLFIYGKNETVVKIPNGIYDLEGINDYIKNNTTCEIEIKSNNNTLKCSLFCTEEVNFQASKTIGALLGFPQVKLEANKWHESEKMANILPPSVIRIECDY